MISMEESNAAIISANKSSETNTSLHESKKKKKNTGFRVFIWKWIKENAIVSFIFNVAF